MNLRPLLFVPPLALGVAGYIWLTAPESEVETAPVDTITAVRTQTIALTSVIPSASGYGRVKAEDSWSAISQVQGRAKFVKDELAIGNIIRAGTEIIRIDSRDYEISLARATASRDSAVAALDELAASEQNTKATIELEKRITKLRNDDVDRKQTLLKRGSVAQASVDTSVRELLAQEKLVLNLENTLRLLPAQRASLQATIDTRVVEIEEAERALANTVISASLSGRVTAKAVSPGQFVRVGDTLVTIDSTRASEIVAEFQTRVLGNLFSVLVGDTAQSDLPTLNFTDASDTLKQLGLTAKVRMQSGERSFFWPAELVRFDGSADPTTGTVGLVVRVDNPSMPDPNRPGPPLTNGTFVEVILSAPKPVKALRVPRSAIHTEAGTEFVYVVDNESRLARAVITTGSVQDDLVVVLTGLPEGKRVVLSNPRPAVIGMRLDPIEDRSKPIR